MKFSSHSSHSLMLVVKIEMLSLRCRLHHLSTFLRTNSFWLQGANCYWRGLYQRDFPLGLREQPQQFNPMLESLWDGVITLGARRKASPPPRRWGPVYSILCWQRLPQNTWKDVKGHPPTQLGIHSGRASLQLLLWSPS